MSLDFTIDNEIKKMNKLYKSEISRIEFQINSLIYKTKEINALINEDNVNKLKEINKIKINDASTVQRILKESPSIKILNEYLDEINRELSTIQRELEIKRSFYDRIKKHIYQTCEHLWISDHFENPALMTMVGCTYCNICGMVRDDV
jgi:hypothetical protein